MTFSREAREAFLAFAVSPAARWPGNFRDFGAAIERMATLAAGGRITSALVEDEVARLQGGAPDAAGAELLDRFLPAPVAEQLDRFDPAAQLAEVLRVCVECRSLSEAGRALFAVSRGRRARNNEPTASASTWAASGCPGGHSRSDGDERAASWAIGKTRALGRDIGGLVKAVAPRHHALAPRTTAKRAITRSGS